MGKFSADLRITSDITMLLVSQYYFFFNCARENYFFAEKRADLYIRSAINSSRSQAVNTGNGELIVVESGVESMISSAIMAQQLTMKETNY